MGMRWMLEVKFRRQRFRKLAKQNIKGCAKRRLDELGGERQREGDSGRAVYDPLDYAWYLKGLFTTHAQGYG
jgi:hypothetical protein